MRFRHDVDVGEGIASASPWPWEQSSPTPSAAGLHLNVTNSDRQSSLPASARHSYSLRTEPRSVYLTDSAAASANLRKYGYDGADSPVAPRPIPSHRALPIAPGRLATQSTFQLGCLSTLSRLRSGSSSLGSENRTVHSENSALNTDNSTLHSGTSTLPRESTPFRSSSSTSARLVRVGVWGYLLGKRLRGGRCLLGGGLRSCGASRRRGHN
jgi:hypothetical protein